MQPPLSRRALLRASGPAIAAALAGCSLTDDQETETPPQTTAIPEETVPKSTTTSNPTPTTEQCQSSPLEPTISEGAAEIFHPHEGTAADLLEQSATMFGETYGVSVTTDSWTTTHFDLKVRRSVPDPDGPELFEYRHDRMAFFSEVVADQSEELRVDPCQYTNPAWDAAQYQGMTVGLPVSAQTVGLYYNEDIVDKPPETFAEMQAVMDEYHDPANDQYGVQIRLAPYQLSGFAQAYGGEIYDEETDQLGVTSDAVERGLQFFFEEVDPYVLYPSEEEEQFSNGTVAFYVAGPWRLDLLLESDIEVGVTTLPALPDGGEMRPYMAVRLVYFSTRVVEDPTDGAVARQFAEWYTTNESHLRTWPAMTEWLPVHTAVVGDTALAEPMRVFSEQCARGYPMPANPKMNQVWGPFGDALEAVHADRQELTDALETADERIREQWAEHSE